MLNFRRNVCRHVSSRLPALSSNSVASSPRGGIPLGARYYSNRKNSSSAEPFYITVDDIFFGIATTWWGYQLTDVDWKGKILQSIEELTKDVREDIAEMEVKLEQLRVKNGRLKKLLNENLESELAGSKTEITNSREVPHRN